MPYVVSTLAMDNHYTRWTEMAGVGSIDKQVTVRGGAGKNSSVAGQIYTPDGVRTELSQEDIDFLKDNYAFKQHMDGGFVRIERSAKDPDTVAQQMNSKDASRPKTQSDVDNYNKDLSKKGAPPETILNVVTNKGK